MKIYTKTGDAGETGLFGGGRVGKDELRVSAYGDLDELNSVLGIARAAGLPEDIDAQLAQLQAELFTLGSELAVSSERADKLPIEPVAQASVDRMERAMDELEARLPPLRTFILPGGSAGAAALHHARTVCRRAERQVVRLSRSEAVRPLVLVYLNRVSDFLFVLARSANQQAGVADVPWVSGT